MFSANENIRKRPRPHENDDKNASSTGDTVSSSTCGVENKDNNNTPPSHVVCLTGFSPKEKDHYHKLIEGLGGRYTQDLNSSRNTHLVAKAPQGAKYEAAVKLNSRIVIVGPLWLEDCYQQQAWIDPPLLHHQEFSAVADNDDDDDNVTTTTKNKKKRAAVATVNKKAAPDILIPSLKLQLESSSENNKLSLLFLDCQFLLIGFELEERNLLTSLVGRGCGTIYWELHDSITHVIIKDECDERLREASERISVQHPNAPVFVSPWWILSCCKHNALQDPWDFTPKYRQLPPPPPGPNHKKLKSNHAEASATRSGGGLMSKQQEQGNLFRGCMFAFLRVSPPPGTVDYKTSDLESLVSSQNGQLLSSQLVDALKVDLARTKNSNINNRGDEAALLSTTKKKCCYVICWGGGISGGTESVMMMHPLLAQVKRKELADIVEATPIWLQTCCTEQRIVPPPRLGILFQPTPWAIRSLPDGVLGQQQQQKSTSSDKLQDKISGGGGDDKKNDSAALQLRISVSGFSGSRRSAMIHLIKVMGALYDDSMRTSTTHLICRKASGLKWRRAMEWKLHVVSIDWLYHVAQYGYKGKQQQQQPAPPPTTTTTNKNSATSSAGCEDRFSLPTASASSVKGHKG